MYFSYLVVLFYCHFIWFYLTCLNLINGDGDLLSECLSVRPSVALVSRAQTAQNIEIFFTSYDTAMFPVCDAKFHKPEFRGLPRTGALNRLLC